jgi:hypothetical protein
MACCVLMAALFGGVALFKTLLLTSPRHRLAAQEWRLPGRDHGSD